MKYISKLFLLAFIGFVACQPAVAQLPNPTISAKYSNEEIAKMVKAHKGVKSKDIRPTSTLQNAVVKDFPGSRDIDWEVAANLYEVEFEIGRTDCKAYYDADGNLLMYSYEISEAELPAIIINAAMDKYPDSKFDDIKKVVKGTETFYVVELDREYVDVKATFTPQGTFIKEIVD
ncbi:MAG: hypothetical protein E6767_01850 [Dysgonomonas sp.]|nr:hypothetical protein [Dysgonomonas sp.]